MTISFKTTREELDIISKIAERADREIFEPYGIQQTRMGTIMDLSAGIANGCPLKLAELLAADDFNFAHDVAGQDAEGNPITEQVQLVLPRFARVQ